MGQSESRSNHLGDRADFEGYLRTGRGFRPIEVKFNPYHDPYNGRFTFAPGGATRKAAVSKGQRMSSGIRSYPSGDPRNPKNYSVRTVRAGDSLEKIAKQRKGVTVADLKWLNDFKGYATRAGQPIKLPHQAFLDAGRDATNRFLALNYYIQTHSGALPPNVAHPPSFAEQFDDPANWHNIDKNGYRFDLDPVERTRRISGPIVSDGSQQRSRTAQANAGGADRLPGDHGGHYIARRFRGPTEAFNHFAQDGNFNLSDYRMLENVWEKNRTAGKEVYVQITPIYDGLSQRPSKIRVSYSIDGRRFKEIFSNRKGSK